MFVRQRQIFYHSLVLAILFAGYAWVQSRADAVNSGFEERSSVLDDPFRTPYLSIRPREAGGGSSPVFILIHGKRCSRAMMMPLARVLGRAGSRVFILDLPGHGLSRVGITLNCDKPSPAEPCLYPAAEIALPILNELSRREKLQDQPITLVGHSWGGGIVETMAEWRPDAKVINLEGYIGPAPDDKRKHLFLPRSPHFLDSVSQFFSFEASHLAMIFSEEVYRKILDWSGLAMANAKGYIWITFASLALRFGMALCLISFLCMIARNPGQSDHLPKVSAVREVLIFFTCLVFARGALWVALLFGSFGKSHGVYMLHFFYFGFAGALSIFYFRKSIEMKFRALCMAATGFSILYFSVSFYSEENIFHLLLTAPRWPRFILVAVAALPLCIASRTLISSRGAWRQWGNRSIFWISVMAIWAIGNESWKAQSDAILYCVFLLATEALSGWFDRKEDRAAGAVLQALLIGWSSTFYPLLS